MAIIIETDKPDELLTQIKNEIKNKKIDTWKEVIHQNLSFFTHVTPNSQWEEKAWFSPVIDKDKKKITFALVQNKEIKVPRGVYTVYHGRFTEMLLKHCQQFFIELRATSNKTTPDEFALEL